MSTALQFTSVFDPTKPPQKLKDGGIGTDTTPVAASKALEARGIKTEAIKDLETPPPVSVADKSENLEPRFMPNSGDIMRKFENLTPEQKRSMEEFFNRLQMQEYMERMQPNEDFRDDMLKDNLQQMYNKMYGERLQAMGPDMNMIMRAQNDDSGIIAMLQSPIAMMRMTDYSGTL
tara:strand:- start:56 stop:583 length:528 start_codon:yes stop_codon:yes gene_type:complete